MGTRSEETIGKGMYATTESMQAYDHTDTWKPLNIHNGDLVWLSAQALALEGNPKLLPKWLRLFEVIEQYTNVYRLRLPTLMKIHQVINIFYLKVFISLHPTNPQWKVLYLVMQDGEFNVEKIYRHRSQGC